MKTDHSEIILAKIKDAHITPKPRWTFLFHDYAVWALSLFSFAVGSLAVSVIIFMMRHGDWGLYGEIQSGFLSFILAGLPYFWFASLAAFIAAAYYNFRRTKKGYRYGLPVFVAASIVSSIILGGLLYQFGAAQAVDGILSARAPYYGRVINPHFMQWAEPGEGRLAGIITGITDAENFTLLDPTENTWFVVYEEQAHAPRVLIRTGERVKMIGEKTDEGRFKALIIRPFGPQAQGFFETRMRLHMREDCGGQFPDCPHDLPMPPGMPGIFAPR